MCCNFPGIWQLFEQKWSSLGTYFTRGRVLCKYFVLLSRLVPSTCKLFLDEQHLTTTHDYLDFRNCYLWNMSTCFRTLCQAYLCQGNGCFKLALHTTQVTVLTLHQLLGFGWYLVFPVRCTSLNWFNFIQTDQLHSLLWIQWKWLPSQVGHLVVKFSTLIQVLDPISNPLKNSYTGPTLPIVRTCTKSNSPCCFLPCCVNALVVNRLWPPCQKAPMEKDIQPLPGHHSSWRWQFSGQAHSCCRWCRGHPVKIYPVKHYTNTHTHNLLSSFSLTYMTAKESTCISQFDLFTGFYFPMHAIFLPKFSLTAQDVFSCPRHFRQTFHYNDHIDKNIIYI